MIVYHSNRKEGKAYSFYCFVAKEEVRKRFITQHSLLVAREEAIGMQVTSWSQKKSQEMRVSIWKHKELNPAHSIDKGCRLSARLSNENSVQLIS